ASSGASACSWRCISVHARNGGDALPVGSPLPSRLEQIRAALLVGLHPVRAGREGDSALISSLSGHRSTNSERARVANAANTSGEWRIRCSPDLIQPVIQSHQKAAALELEFGRHTSDAQTGRITLAPAILELAEQLLRNAVVHAALHL